MEGELFSNGKLKNNSSFDRIRNNTNILSQSNCHKSILWVHKMTQNVCNEKLVNET